jgi:hypothetical protein
MKSTLDSDLYLARKQRLLALNWALRATMLPNPYATAFRRKEILIEEDIL